jgi:hypothetical protein
MQKMVLPGEWDNSSIPPLPNRRGRRAKKRRLVVVAAVVLLALVLTGGSTLALFKFNPSLLSNTVNYGKQKGQYTTQNKGSPTTMMMMNNQGQPVTSITNLTRISVVGSTALILDGQGRTISVDANPYGVAIVPAGIPVATTAGSLKPGDIVVTNVGANDTGATLVRFPAGKGPGLLFNTMATGTKGPALEAFNPLTGSDWVANFSANKVQVFNSNGTLKATITNPLFNRPWAMASNRGMRNARDGAVGSFFTTNAGDATIDRIDMIPSGKGTTFRVFQIGQLTQINGGAENGLMWVPSLQLGGQQFSDVLLAVDMANNRIAVYPNSSTMNTTTMRSTNKGMTAFQGKPLNSPNSLTVNPLNGDILVTNGNDNNLVELNLAQGKAVGTRALDNVPVDAQSGNGSALVGLAAATDAKGNLEVFFVDDNLNTLNVLGV